MCDGCWALCLICNGAYLQYNDHTLDHRIMVDGSLINNLMYANTTIIIAGSEVWKKVRRRACT